MDRSRFHTMKKDRDNQGVDNKVLSQTWCMWFRVPTEWNDSVYVHFKHQGS